MHHPFTLRFGHFELRARQRLLLQDGRPVPLGARPFDVLLALAERRERVVTKLELLDIAWPNLVVEENNLQVQVSLLRKLLGAQAIATIPGRGYRFTAPVDELGDGERGAGARGAAAGNVPTSLQTNLPKVLPRLYGRETDLGALRSLIEAHELVTVVGAGGIGKSRLAQAVAHSLVEGWPDGAWMVELAGLSDPALVPNAAAQALGIMITRQSAALDELLAGLSQRALLLVLDNCEHLLDAVALLAQAVALHAPQVKLLCTSQEPLHLAAEQQYRVMPLAVPPETSVFGARAFGAVALFDARVRAADPRFALSDENLALAIAICRRLDGLPLAIELAAARVPALGPRVVYDKLDARYRLLTGGSRAALRRHQTLRAAMEWSYQLLDVAEQAVFRHLGVFAGGFTMELAQAVARDAQLDEWAVLDHLSALVDKSLVIADPGDPPRYRLLESARAFALEQLAAGEMTATLKQHALAVRRFFESVDGPNLDGELRTEQLRALLLPEADNLRAAHAWAIGSDGDVQTAVVLASCASALEDFALESADWLLPLQPAVQDGAVGIAVAARFLRAIASANVGMTGRVPREVQIEAAERAQSLYRALAQPRRAFSSLTQLATYHMTMGDNAGAQRAANEARGLMQADWPAMLRVRLLRVDGYLAESAGRLPQALALHRETMRVSLTTGDWLLEVMAREDLADLLWRMGSLEDAAREACGLIDALREQPLTPLDMVGPYGLVTGILCEMGRIEEASTAAREALPLARRFTGPCLKIWIHLIWRCGQIESAALLLGASDAWHARTGRPPSPDGNGQRLIAETRAGLAASLGEERLAGALAAGAVLNESELLALMVEALALPRGNDPQSSRAGAGASPAA